MSDIKVTLDHVARLAGVSKVTVSKVLNSTGRISEATKDKVMQAADQLGYVANPAARALRGRPTQMFGMVLPEITSPYFAELARYAAEYAAQAGFDLALFTTSRDASRERARISTILGGMADGLIVVVPHASASFLSALERNSSPIVLINHFGSNSHLPSVRGDNFSGSVAAVRHLIELGHKRIGFIGGAPHSSQAAERLRAYKECLLAAGLYDANLTAQGDFTQKRGFEATLELLSLPQRPTAIFASSDLTALGAMDGAKSLGLSIPEDLSIAGFDNIASSSFSNPTLTTVAHPIEDIARTAIDMLVRMVEQNENFHDVHTEYPSHLVVRASTAAPLS